MEALKLKICHYLNCESDIHLGMLRKANVKSEHNFGRFAELLGPLLTCASTVQEASNVSGHW